MKTGTLQGTISAKMVFEIVSTIGEVVNKNFHIYEITAEDDSGQKFRCDMGDLGSFEISHSTEEEVYSAEHEDWVLVEKNSYTYHCDLEGIQLPMDVAYDTLIKYEPWNE